MVVYTKRSISFSGDVTKDLINSPTKGLSSLAPALAPSSCMALAGLVPGSISRDSTNGELPSGSPISYGTSATLNTNEN